MLSPADCRTILEQSPLMIWRSGLDKRCVYFNQRWCEFTGRSLEEEYGDGWATGVHPEDLVHCLSVYVEAFNARRAFEMYYRLRRHDGEYRWIFDRGAPSRDEQGAFCGFVGSCIDVTEQVLVDPELESRCRRTSRRPGKLIPMCAWCRRIRNAEDHWLEVHQYLFSRPQDITHTVCPECQSLLLQGLQYGVQRKQPEA